MKRYRIYFNGNVLSSYDDKRSALDYYAQLLADHDDDVEFCDDNDIFVYDSQRDEELCSTILHRNRLGE